MHSEKQALLFLYESGLIDKDKRIIDLSKADLSRAFLFKADLRGANLGFANLRGAVPLDSLSGRV